MSELYQIGEPLTFHVALDIQFASVIGYFTDQIHNPYTYFLKVTT